MILLYEFMILLITSMLSILLFVIFNALLIYDEEGFDYRGYNCYGKNIHGNIDKSTWKYFIFQQDIIEYNQYNNNEKYIYYYNPFFDNLPSHIMIFLIVSINHVILGYLF